MTESLGHFPSLSQTFLASSSVDHLFFFFQRTKTAINIGQGSLKPILPSQQGPLYSRRIHPKGEQVTFQPHPSLESLYVGCSWSLQPVLYSGLKSQDYEGLVLSDCKLLKSEMPSQESEIPGTDPTSSFNSTR
ncbi:unnamed protein product [Lepidochelys kempii]